MKNDGLMQELGGCWVNTREHLACLALYPKAGSMAWGWGSSGILVHTTHTPAAVSLADPQIVQMAHLLAARAEKGLVKSADSRNSRPRKDVAGSQQNRTKSCVKSIDYFRQALVQCSSMKRTN